jgi:hypothetical protein
MLGEGRGDEDENGIEMTVFWDVTPCTSKDRNPLPPSLVRKTEQNRKRCYIISGREDQNRSHEQTNRNWISIYTAECLKWDPNP